MLHITKILAEAKDQDFHIFWTKDRLKVKKYFNRYTNIYFDVATVPKLLDSTNPNYTFGIAVDSFGRALGGIVVGFEGYGENNYNVDPKLPFIYELCAASTEGIGENSNIAAPCWYAQKGVGTALVEAFAKRVNYNFWFTCADLKIATPFWKKLVNRLSVKCKLVRLGTTNWHTPVYKIEKSEELDEICTGASFAKAAPGKKSKIIIPK